MIEMDADKRALLARAEKAEAERDEARRRRDEWRKKAEGYDDVRRALREKVGDPWPPHMSRILWAGIAADEKKRADEAEAERDEWRNQAKRYKSQAISLLNDRLDGTWRDQVEQDAWNDAIEAAARYHDNFLVTKTGVEVEIIVASTEAILALRKGEPT